jgi:polyisoprenoid-binding protein YceI
MKKLKILFIAIYLFSSFNLEAQDIYLTRNGQITFFSSTSIEDIKATNNEVSSVLNKKTGTLQFIVLIKSFQFKKTAMQEHFNKKDYMNSDTYPKSEFKGLITDINKVDFTKDGTYPVNVEGNLTLHGVSNKIKTTGVVIVKAGKMSTTSKFNIKLEDYQISVPSIVTSKVAEVVEVTVNCNYDLYQPKS